MVLSYTCLIGHDRSYVFSPYEATLNFDEKKYVALSEHLFTRPLKKFKIGMLRFHFRPFLKFFFKCAASSYLSWSVRVQHLLKSLSDNIVNNIPTMKLSGKLR